jgi:hypothetical protein
MICAYARAALAVAHGVYTGEDEALLFVLDPGVGRGVEQRPPHDDDAASQKAGLRLEDNSPDLDGPIAFDAALAVHGERRGEV